MAKRTKKQPTVIGGHSIDNPSRMPPYIPNQLGTPMGDILNPTNFPQPGDKSNKLRANR